MDRFKSTLIGLMLGGMLLAAWSSPAVAQQDKERKTKETVAMSQQVYEKLAEIQELIEVVIVTCGERGSTVHTAEDAWEIPIVPPRRIADPTGVGDAYRAGFITGMCQGLPWDVVGRMGSLAAAYVLEEHGTQRHHYSLDGFRERYRETFGGELNL